MGSHWSHSGQNRQNLTGGYANGPTGVNVCVRTHAHVRVLHAYVTGRALCNCLDRAHSIVEAVLVLQHTTFIWFTTYMLVYNIQQTFRVEHTSVGQLATWQHVVVTPVVRRARQRRNLVLILHDRNDRVYPHHIVRQAGHTPPRLGRTPAPY